MDRAQGLSGSVQKAEIKVSIAKVIESGLEVNTGEKYCYKKVNGKYLVGSDICRICAIEDDNKMFFDNIDEAVNCLLSHKVRS